MDEAIVHQGRMEAEAMASHLDAFSAYPNQT